MACTHDAIRELSTEAYTGPVGRDENRAAHGCVCVHEECARCGARRRRNVNQTHEETGDWGSTRSERDAQARAAERVASEIAARRPAPLTLSHPSGRRARVHVDHAGYLVADGPVSGEDIAAAIPALVEFARELRLAALHAAELRESV